MMPSIMALPSLLILLCDPRTPPCHTIATDYRSCCRRCSTVAYNASLDGGKADGGSNSVHARECMSPAPWLLSLSLRVMSALACQPLDPAGWSQLARDAYKRLGLLVHTPLDESGCHLQRVLLLQAVAIGHCKVRARPVVLLSLVRSLQLKSLYWT